MKPVRLAIVDDSLFVREALVRLFRGDARVTVVGSAGTGEELLENLDTWRPDVATLDLNMPGMGGMAALERIMAVRPMPVIILSTHSGDGAPLTLEALSRGAADFIDKEGYSLMDFQVAREVLLEKILAVTGTADPVEVAPPRPVPPREPPPVPKPGPAPRQGQYDVVLVGASTGGPSAIEKVLTDLGPDVPIPIAVVQHMPFGFTGALADRLNRFLPISVCEASDHDQLARGTVYVAPAGQHLKLKTKENRLIAVLSDSPADSIHRPSVDVLFSSMAELPRLRAAAVLLTGMGKDGAQGMSQLAQVGGHTIAQDEESCVVYGMPRAAVELNAAREILPLDGVGARLRELMGVSPQ